MTASKPEIKSEINDLVTAVTAYFRKCHEALGEKATSNSWMDRTDHYWTDIPDSLKAEADDFRKRIIDLTQKALTLCRVSLLINDADIFEVKTITKKLLALIQLRKYFYYAPDVIQNEGTILGFEPGSQEERDPQTPMKALLAFKIEANALTRIIDLADTESSFVASTKQGGSNVGAYRQNTAFVMMWMDRSKADLEDIRDAVVEIFRAFGITAIRADDIEHEGVITQRVLDEIRTSEFLFADISGSRPNVYYEVGFAHALGKRVILFRKQGTTMHFDLAGYNCPEYANIRDLKNKLTKRLESLTNRASTRPAAEGENT